MVERTPPVLQVIELAKSFDARGHGGRKLWALDGVDLDVASGRIVGVVGESGCGKSTLLRTIVRLEDPTLGRVLFRGDDVHGLRGEALRGYRRRVQLVFQDSHAALPPRMAAGAAVEEPLRIFKVGDAEGRARRVGELFDLVGLPQTMRARYPHQLSGGQRQRVNIARALALEPDLLLLDEPVSALDVSVQAQVLNLLRDLQRRMGLSYLFISHDLRVVRYLCDEVAVMYLGRVVEQGSAALLFARPAHPYTLALLRSIPDHVAGGSVRTRLAGEAPSPIDRPAGCPFHPRCRFARPVCATERPELRLVAATGSLAACHFAEEIAAADSAATATDRGTAPELGASA
jgi:oligopeptide/dipeptide ABC transporter ATP-binding protein